MSGFTKVDNNILEEVSKRKFNASQLSVLMIVWRMTYGFNREDHELAVNYFVQATGFSKRNIQDTLNSLIDGKVLKETQQASFNQTRKIAFNKNIDEWLLDSRTKLPQVNNPSPHEEMFTSPDEQKFTSSGDESFTSPGEQSFTQERNTLKKDIKKNIKKGRKLKKSYDESNIYFQMSLKLLNNIRENNPKFKEPDLQKWSDDFRKIKELDERSEQDINLLIDWCQKDDFWKTNILSPDKLRKQFDRLWMQSQKKNGNYVAKRTVIQDIPKKRPDHWDDPEPLTKDELRQLKSLEDELPF